MTVTVVTPTIAPRTMRLAEAVGSVLGQTRPADAYVIEYDHTHAGAAATRTRATLRATTDYVAYLDDDDQLLPEHLEVLLASAAETGADVTYTGCVVLDPLGRPIPLQEEWGRFGRPFDGELLLQTSYLPVTSLVRTEYARRHPFATSADTDHEDWNFYKALYLDGAAFHHVPRVTWVWNHWGGNTSGRGDRW